ncbi:MAG TPA: tRNA (adenosine(37)-N6)-dimethylallyltransferase MiaA [Actinomycetota bacterium]|jgi:tRNA dimethylallyltransferase|nr:tRNA (adenosine(37)-N6)-dimethylallyltransferase MiaA [Actinomycetota bacterium]
MLRALVGPTASGKTDAGIALATRSGVEIASVDSMLVYRGMDVGTAKPTAEQQRALPHHLMDLAEPSERFTVARYQQAAHDLLDRVPDPLLVGGSGLYFRAVVDRLRFPPEDPAVRASLEAEADVLGADELYERLSAADPVAAARIDPANVRRTIRALEVSTITGAPFSDFAAAWEVYDPALVRVAGIRLASATLDARVRARVARMLETGWIDEVRDLMERGFGAWLTASQAIGYAELAAHLDGRLALDEAMERTVKRTKELARRQMAWFRRDPRVRWFDAGEDGAVAVVDEVAAYLGAA